MNKIGKIISRIVIISSAVVAMSITAWAGTISSISLKVGTDFSGGDTLPDISLDGDSGTYVSVSGSKCIITSAEWVSSTSKEIKIGEEPKMKVTLEPSNSDDYYFKGTYSSGNVHVSGGSYVSSTKKNGNLVVTLKTKAIKGTYDAPEDAYWKDGNSNSSLGHAYWKAGDLSSGYYEVVLYRGGTSVHKVESTQSKSYNFYPYMTKAGTYKFKVRAIPKPNSSKKEGTRSEWTESDEIYIDSKHTSDGSGQSSNSSSGNNNGSTPGNFNVGWIKDNGSWYYRYPDGSYQKNSWLKVEDKWYAFDTDGRMRTGWYSANGAKYYLKSEGDMYTGWLQDGNRKYFLNTNKDNTEGLLHTGWLIVDGKTYYMDPSDGAMTEGWKEIDGNWYFFYQGSGEKAVNTTISTFYVDENGVWRR